MSEQIVEINGKLYRINIPSVINPDQVQLEYHPHVPVPSTQNGIIEITTVVSRVAEGIYSIFRTVVNHTKDEESMVEHQFAIRVTQPEKVGRSLDSFTKREKHGFFIARMVREVTGLEMTSEWSVIPVENILLAPVMGYLPSDPSDATWTGRLITRVIYYHQTSIRFRKLTMERNIVYVERASFPDLL